ncbi:thiamine-monophosphate kinase [Geomicrobium halophilum]|uniref:Thiamine-monophosphate kinase n=1 Tax=Geomicrobium halophilum TaxID=549000 RepID=A0A841Q0I1_9BACL|nr:thiamine-phosphate kinase [Geomicrobium halophilum]MBB6451022.1 thiamine-monophosphate kinase [Geomicrobium halophilum]
MDEFDLIRKIDHLTKDGEDVEVGIGDDAAVVSGFENNRLISCVDTLCEDVHFKRSTLKLTDIGYKALAVNLSDIAAMGGIPRYYLVSLAIPADWDEAEIIEIYRGMNELADRYQVTLIGGDSVTSKGPLTISVTVLGEIEKDHALLRSTSQEGDVVFVSGALGKSSAGLDILFSKGLEGKRSADEEELVFAHQRPCPQVELGRMLMKSGVRIALNDISDGLSAEIWELAEASRARICLEEDKIPVSKEAINIFGKSGALEYALNGGEDFQLVGTVAREHWSAIQLNAYENGITLSAIGTVAGRGSEVLIQKNNEWMPLKRAGYRHQ